MTEFEEDGQEAIEDTTYEISELKRIFRHIHAALEERLSRAPGIDARTPQAVITQLSELQIAHRQICAAQEAFNAEYPDTDTTADIDIDLSELRTEIGSQLDRLRAAILADKLPFDVDPCAACRAALSL